METDKHNNKNLGDTQAENSADRSNMPNNQVPRHRSNDHEQINRVKSDAGFPSRELGEGDFGSEKARADPEKGNKGHAGNMPNAVLKDQEE